MAGTNGPGRLAGNARIKYGDGATPTELFTAISKVKSIGFPRETRDTAEVTNFDSTGYTKQYIPGWGDVSEISVAANWVADASQDNSTGILSVFRTRKGQNINWKIEVLNTDTGAADGFTLAFSGALLTCGLSDLTPGGAMELTMTIKPSGTPVMTAAPTS